MRLFSIIVGIGCLMLAPFVLSDDSTSCCTLPLLMLGLSSLFINLFKKKDKRQTNQARQQKSQPNRRSPSGITFSYNTTHGSQFVKQAQRYVNRQGKPVKHHPFQTYWPTYGAMNRAQQAWYFYWRGQVRQGHYPDTSLSYIFVHIYELINNVGVANTTDGYRQLRRLWLNYRERYPRLDSYLSTWITDYLAANPGALDPLSMYADPELQPFLVKQASDLVLHAFLEHSTSLHNIPLSLLDALTDYRIQRSRFYQSGYDKTITMTLAQVLKAVDEHLRRQDKQGIFQKYQPQSSIPFQAGTFDSAIYKGSAKPVTIARIHHYSKHEPIRQFLTAIVKHTENLLRRQHNFSGRLKVPRLSRDIIAVIDQTVALRAVSMPEATEFKLPVHQSPDRRSSAVPVPPQKETVLPSTGKLRVVSRYYLELATKLASYPAKPCAAVPLNTPSTHYTYDYATLTQEQMNWYFYWRDQARHQRYLQTDLAYIFMYAPELVHLVGVEDADQAYQQLRALWLNYREPYPQIETHLLSWMLSLVTAHPCQVTPGEILRQPEAQAYTLAAAPDVLLTPYIPDRLRDIPLALLDRFIDYDIQQSSFYTAGHQDLMQRVIPVALELVNKHARKNGGTSLFDQYPSPPLTIEVRECWRATQTYVHWPTRIALKDTPAFSQNEKACSLLTGIVKYTENKLREEKKHRGRLRANGIDAQMQTLIDQFIAHNANIINPPPPAPKVQIDLSRVQKLQSESEEVQEMLYIDGTDERETPTFAQATPVTVIPLEAEREADASDAPAMVVPTLDTDEEFWVEMASVLDEHQVAVLSAILEDDSPEASIQRIAAEHFTMPTLLVDGINELAQDVIGDILIELEPTTHLIDEYTSLVTQIIAERRNQ